MPSDTKFIFAPGKFINVRTSILLKIGGPLQLVVVLVYMLFIDV